MPKVGEIMLALEICLWFFLLGLIFESNFYLFFGSVRKDSSHQRRTETQRFLGEQVLKQNLFGLFGGCGC